mmetsp:Transcript_52273/g.87226  ORF Transcript_52273/g.87226 Transcript_52273/m.87226 type:complete len:208 (+) Transcript_52273:923-1546(+)
MVPITAVWGRRIIDRFTMSTAAISMSAFFPIPKLPQHSSAPNPGAGRAEGIAEQLPKGPVPTAPRDTATTGKDRYNRYDESGSFQADAHLCKLHSFLIMIGYNVHWKLLTVHTLSRGNQKQHCFLQALQAEMRRYTAVSSCRTQWECVANRHIYIQVADEHVSTIIVFPNSHLKGAPRLKVWCAHFKTHYKVFANLRFHTFLGKSDI